MVDQAVHDTALAEIANLQNQLSASNLAKDEAFIKGQTAVIADFKEKANTGHSSLPVLKPSKYNSNDNFLDFIEIFSTFCDATNVTKTNILPLLSTYLDHTALRKVKNLHLTTLADYDEGLKAITKALINDTPARSRAKLQNQKQGEGEPIQEFINKIVQLADGAYGTGNSEIKSQILIDVLLAGTRDKSLAFAIPAAYTNNDAQTSFTEYCRRAVDLENAMGLRIESTLVETDVPKFKIFDVHEGNAEGSRDNYANRDKFANAGPNNYRSNDDFARPGPNNYRRNDNFARDSDRRQLTCWNCFKPGHVARNCWSKDKFQSPQGMRNQWNTGQNNVRPQASNYRPRFTANEYSGPPRNYVYTQQQRPQQQQYTGPYNEGPNRTQQNVRRLPSAWTQQNDQHALTKN